MKTQFIFLSAIVGLSMYGCSSVPITGRSQLNLVSDADVLSSSLTEYQGYMASAKVSTNKTQSTLVTQVGTRLAAATETYLRNNGMESELSNFAWEFNLVQDDEVNAFCMPGGKIVVYEGLMKVVSSEDELAVVIGHEVAHAVAKHSNERMSQQVLAQYGSSILTAAIAKKSAAVQSLAGKIYGLGTQYGVMLPFSRKQEYEADYMGTILMTIAGYNPEAAIAFWEKMSQTGSSSAPEFMSSHPSDANRISALKKTVEDLKKLSAQNAANASAAKTSAAKTSSSTLRIK